MRSLLIALMTVILISAALLGLALYRIDTIISWNKDRIAAAFARRTGRDLDFDRAHVTLRGGVRVRIRGLAVSEERTAGSGRFFEAPALEVGLKFHPLRREITVTHVDTAGATLHYRNGQRHLQLRDLRLTVDADRAGAFGFRLGGAAFSGTGVVESFTPLVIAYDLRAPRLRLADLQLEPADAALEEARVTGRLGWTGGLEGGAALTAARGMFPGFDYTDLAAAVEVDGPWLVLESLRLKALDGELEARGRAQLRTAPFPFEAALHVRGIDIGARLDGVAGLPPVEGTLEGRLEITGQGRVWEDVKPTLAGAGRAAVTGGRVLDFNLAEQALAGITGITGLSGLVSRRLRDRYPQIFQRGATVLEQLDGEFRVAGARVVVERVTLEAADYGLTGKGSVDLDGGTAVKGLLTLSPELSADLRLPSRLLGARANGRGEFELPFSVEGTLPDVRVRPGGQLAARLLQGGAGARLEQLGELFSGGKGGERRQENAEGSRDAAAPETPQGRPRTTPRADEPLRRLIERGLRIFRGND